MVIFGENAMDYEIITKPAFKVLGMSRRICNDNAQTEIPNMWKKFILENYPEKIPHKKSENLLALYTDYEGDHTKPYHYTIGCEVEFFDKEPPFVLDKIEVPENKYALFKIKGKLPEALIEGWRTIWSCKELERKYEADLEVVAGPEDLLIYISVK